MNNFWVRAAISAVIVIIFFVVYSFFANQSKFKPSDGCELVCTPEPGAPANGAKPSPSCKKVCPL